MNSKVLIIGNAGYIHLKKLNEHLHQVNKGEVTLDFFHLGYEGEMDGAQVYSMQKHFPIRGYRIGILSEILAIIDLFLTFSKMKKYDLINIHFLTLHSVFLLPLLKIKSKRIMISPWGSDVYRVHGIKKYLYRIIYQLSDYVAIPETGFRKDVQNIFGVPFRKIIDVGFGSEMIDFILKKAKINKDESKEKLGLKNHFLIACGYNRTVSQNHKIIIDALVENKKNLPAQTVLIFPFTYGKEYDLSLYFKKLDDNGLKYIILRDFLDDEKLFQVESAADIFIHIQDSDANSAFMQEFLLCDALVMNGGWLTYEHLEKEGLPYILVPGKNVQSLSGIIKKVTAADFTRPLNADAKKVISEFAWSVQIRKWYSFFKKVGN